MTLTVPIPDNLDKAVVDALDHAVRETIAVRLYREGRLSHGKLAEYLGIGRGQADDVLARNGIVDEFTLEEIAEQVRASREFRCGKDAG